MGHGSIPHAHRWQAYQYLTGGADLAAAAPGLYHSLLRLGPAPEVDLVIRHDSHRTLPSLRFFGPLDRPGPGQSQLYRILTAFANLDEEVRYTQGMNFVAANLLLAGLSEEAAFYAFAGLMAQCGLRGLYQPGLPLAFAAHDRLDELLARGWPALAAHLQAAGVTPQLYATPWLLSGFVSSPLPLSSVLMVFDRLLLEAAPTSLPTAIAARITHVCGSVVRPPQLQPTAAAPQATHGHTSTSAVPSTATRTSGWRGNRWGRGKRGGTDATPVAVATDPAAPQGAVAAGGHDNSGVAAGADVAELRVPRALLRAALVLVTAPAGKLLASQNPDDVYATIKDEYEPLRSAADAQPKDEEAGALGFVVDGDSDATADESAVHGCADSGAPKQNDNGPAEAQPATASGGLFSMLASFSRGRYTASVVPLDATGSSESEPTAIATAAAADSAGRSGAAFSSDLLESTSLEAVKDSDRPSLGPTAFSGTGNASGATSNGVASSLVTTGARAVAGAISSVTSTAVSIAATPAVVVGYGLHRFSRAAGFSTHSSQPPSAGSIGSGGGGGLATMSAEAAVAAMHAAQRGMPVLPSQHECRWSGVSAGDSINSDDGAHSLPGDASGVEGCSGSSGGEPGSASSGTTRGRRRHSRRLTAPVFPLVPEPSLYEFGAALIRFETIDRQRLDIGAMLAREDASHEAQVAHMAAGASAPSADGSLGNGVAGWLLAGSDVTDGGVDEGGDTTEQRHSGHGERHMSKVNAEPPPAETFDVNAELGLDDCGRTNQQETADIVLGPGIFPPRQRGIFEASLGVRLLQPVVADAHAAGNVAGARGGGGTSAGRRTPQCHKQQQLRVAAVACDGKPCSDWTLPVAFATQLQGARLRRLGLL